MSDIQLISIIAPQLSDTQYGQSVVTQFENIDRNFKTLANHDFVKGEDGKSVKVIDPHILFIRPEEYQGLQYGVVFSIHHLILITEVFSLHRIGHYKKLQITE